MTIEGVVVRMLPYTENKAAYTALARITGIMRMLHAAFGTLTIIVLPAMVALFAAVFTGANAIFPDVAAEGLAIGLTADQADGLISAGCGGLFNVVLVIVLVAALVTDTIAVIVGGEALDIIIKDRATLGVVPVVDGLVAFSAFDMHVLKCFASMVVSRATIVALAFNPNMGLMNGVAAVGANAVYPVVVCLGASRNGNADCRVTLCPVGSCSRHLTSGFLPTIVQSRKRRGCLRKTTLAILNNLEHGLALTRPQVRAIRLGLLNALFHVDNVFLIMIALFSMRMFMHTRHRHHSHDHSQCHYPGKYLSLHVVLLSYIPENSNNRSTSHESDVPRSFCRKREGCSLVLYVTSHLSLPIPLPRSHLPVIPPPSSTRSLVVLAKTANILCLKRLAPRTQLCPYRYP